MHNKRYEYIDAVKGLSILCITFLHYESGVIPLWLNTWIGMFMITAFYFTSGWIIGIRNKILKPKELFKKRLRQIGIPYLWFSILILIFDIIWILLGYMDMKIFFRDIYKTLVFRGIGTLWFLPVLMFAEVIFCYLIKKRYYVILFALFLSIAFTYIYSKYWNPYLNLGNDKFMIIDGPIRPIFYICKAWPIIFIGYLFGKNLGMKLENINKYYLSLIGVSILLISVVLIKYNSLNLYFVNETLSNFLPVLGFILLFDALNKCKFSKFFEYWGKNSLILMCTHYSLILLICQTFCKQFLNLPFDGMITIYLFIFTIIIEYPIVWIFNNKLKFMLGK